MAFNAILSLGFSNEDTTEQVSLQEAKAFLSIDFDSVDSLVSMLITQARKQCESYANRSLIDRTITTEIQNQLGSFDLPYGKVQQINSVKDIDGNDVDWKHYGSLVTEPKDYLKVVYRTSKIDAKLAILNQVQYLYDNRGESELVLSTKNILKAFRNVST